MEPRVLHMIVCELASRDSLTGLLSCRGIFQQAAVAAFPGAVNFAMVAWLSNLEANHNRFDITVKNRAGIVIGSKKAVAAYSDYEGSGDILFHFNNFLLQNEQDRITIEISQNGNLLGCKNIRAICCKPVVQAEQPIKDKGFFNWD